MENSPIRADAIRAEIDLHCHVLPDWDDGPSDLDGSLALVERAASCGTKLIFATPHVGRSFGGRKRSSDEIAEGVAKLQSEIDARNLGVQIVAGAELMMGQVDVSRPDGLKMSWTYGGAQKFALIESPMRTWPPFGNHVVQELLRRGITPVLAHPERYLDVQKSLSALEIALNQGALVQITAGALKGEGGKDGQKCAREMLRAGMVHFVASDAHMASHTMPGEVIELVVELCGEGRARQIFEDNPCAVRDGKRLPHQIAPPVAAPSLFQKFFGKR